MSKRCVVTGLGIVAPNGIGKEKFWENIKNGSTGIKKITHYDTSNFQVKTAGVITDFNPKAFFSEETAYATVRFSQFATASTQMAIKDAKLELDKVIPERVKEVRVVGEKGKYGLETVKAIIEPHKGSTLDQREIIKFCQGKMAKYKIPKIIELKN